MTTDSNGPTEFVAVRRDDLRALADHADDCWIDEVQAVPIMRRIAAVLAREACANCGGLLDREPLAPHGVVHVNRDLLCPGHTTVSSDGSNVASPQPSEPVAS